MAYEGERVPAAGLSTRTPAVDRFEDDVESALADRVTRVVESAVEVLGVDSVGLMLLDAQDTLRPAGSTDTPAAELERVQVEIGEGPGVDASAQDQTIAVTDLAENPGYARLWRRLASTGVRAVLASPVRVWGTVIGNLNAVRRDAHRWTESEIRAHEAYAKVIGVAFDVAAHAVGAGRNHHPQPGRPEPLPDGNRRADVGR